MGVGSRTKAWRFTDINKDYSVGTRCLRWSFIDDPQRFSSVQHILLDWSFQPKSAIQLCNMLRDIGVNAGYLSSVIFTGRITCVVSTSYHPLVLKEDIYAGKHNSF
jgi:hypothetical protein